MFLYLCTKFKRIEGQSSCELGTEGRGKRIALIITNMDEILGYYKDLNGKYLNECKLEDCAKKMMGGYCIKKKDAFYQIAEIEFYFYSPDHRDIITYPRRCSGKLWFFHQSGVDLTIKSSEKGEEPHFGGILIRSVIKYDNAWNKLETICGPQKCVNELFDVLNAVDNSNELTPLLEKHDFGSVEVVSSQRYIPFNVPTKKESRDKKDYQHEIRELAKRKRYNILSENQKRESNANRKSREWLIASEEQNSFDSFCDYLQAKYRYYMKDVQWEKGYKAANMDKRENCYKYLLVTI